MEWGNRDYVREKDGMGKQRLRERERWNGETETT